MPDTIKILANIFWIKMMEKNFGLPEKNSVNQVPLSTRVEQSLTHEILDEQIKKRVKVFKQYDKFLGNANLQFFMEKYPIAGLEPDNFLKLLNGIRESKKSVLPLYLNHAAYSNNRHIRYLTIKYPHEDKQDTSKDGYNIFVTDLDIYKNDKYLEFMKKLETFEEKLTELKTENEGQKVFRLTEGLEEK